jgi:hypothetical protein
MENTEGATVVIVGRFQILQDTKASEGAQGMFGKLRIDGYGIDLS